MTVLFLDPPQLLLYVHRLHLLNASSILSWIWLSIIGESCLLSTSLFLSRDRLASGTVVNVVALTSKALEVIRNISGVDRGRVALLGLVSLFFPAWVEQFD